MKNGKVKFASPIYDNNKIKKIKKRGELILSCTKFLPLKLQRITFQWGILFASPKRKEQICPRVC